MVHPQLDTLGELESGANDGGDVSAVELSSPGFHQQVVDLVAMQLEGQPMQAPCPRSFLAFARNRCANSYDIEAVDPSHRLDRIAALLGVHLVPVQFAGVAL